MKTLLAAALSFALFSTVLPSHASARPGPPYATPAEMDIFNQRVGFAQTNGQQAYSNGVRERRAGINVYWVPPSPGTPAYTVTGVLSHNRASGPINLVVVSDTAVTNSYGQVVCSGRVLAKMNGKLIRGGRNMSIIISLDTTYGARVTINGPSETVMIPGEGGPRPRPQW